MSSLTCPGCGAAAGPEQSICPYCSRPLATLGCSNCFARLFEGMLFCPSCGARAERPVPGAPEVLACPGCADHGTTSSLRRVDLGQYHLHECLACHGLWLDVETVNALETDKSARARFAPEAVSTTVMAMDTPSGAKAVAGENPGAIAGSIAVHATSGSAASSGLHSTTAPTFRYRRCPVCAKLMQRHNVARISGVIVDRCVAHGTFFDADELHAVVRFWENGGLDRARRREREALEAERKRMEMLQRIDAGRERLEGMPPAEPPSFLVTAWLAALLRPPR